LCKGEAKKKSHFTGDGAKKADLLGYEDRENVWRIQLCVRKISVELVGSVHDGIVPRGEYSLRGRTCQTRGQEDWGGGAKKRRISLRLIQLRSQKSRTNCLGDVGIILLCWDLREKEESMNN